MDRNEISHWLDEHRDLVEGDPAALLQRCEAEVRRHTSEDAWLAAKDYVERRMRAWQLEWGFHASEAHVAREVCPRIARELRRHEPHPGSGDEEHLAGAELLRSLQPEARAKVIQWILELAANEQHRIWLEIVRFTRGRGRAMIRDGRVSSRDSWEATSNHQAKAAHIAELLAGEYAAQARPRGSS